MMRSIRCAVALAGLWLVQAGPAAFAMEIVWPLGRTVYQTNETIDLSVVRSADPDLKAGTLTLTLTDDGGSRFEWAFAVVGDVSRRTEHLHLNGWLLRPGTYRTELKVDGQDASATFEVCSHLRESSFRLINWTRAEKPEQQLIQGEDSLGFNLVYGNPGQYDLDGFTRAGVDFMAVCTMSGGHQMDLRPECDWSDPYVIRGGTRRAVRRALADRTRGNVLGVHFYDEPGLTWHQDEASHASTPHGVPSQIRSYRAAFDRQPLSLSEYNAASPRPEQVAAWTHFNRWKLGFLDAAWQDAQFGVNRVRPDFLSVTQTQYGWTAFADGYSFTAARSLPVTSGHGGYHDYGLGTFNPSYFLEMARARDHARPCWYLPTWYGNTTADQFRLEQYLSFQTGIQGMISPPDCEPATNAGPRQGIVESNQLMKKLGPILTTTPPSPPPVALLYSLSQCFHAQAVDTSQNYAHSLPHGQKLPLAYMALKMIQQPMAAVVDEDVRDGTLAANHRAILLTGLDYLDPEVIAGLEDYAAHGGTVLMTADCTVTIPGARKLDVQPRLPDQEKVDELTRAGKFGELGPFTTVSKQMAGATPLGKALKGEFERLGLRPAFGCDRHTIAATRHVLGEVEYLFAVNGTPDPDARDDKGQPVNNALLPTMATISLPADGRPVYDAVLGIPLKPNVRERSTLDLKYRFGPGQMRVFARTARPIGGVKLAAPIVSRDLAREQEPICVRLAAAVVDEAGGVLSGSMPLQIQVVDSLGTTRFEMYRSTTLGEFQETLPIAANDAVGEWKVTIRELLSGRAATTAFQYAPPRIAPALAGASWRALHFADDRANAFRFVRTFSDVTIVPGSSEFNQAAADRLAKSLEPWGVRCRVMALDEAARARSISEDEAPTWIGLDYAAHGQVKPGADNPPSLSGFAVRGPVILLGNPDDHPIIKFLDQQHFLPYRIAKDTTPGAHRGLYAWQLDGVGAGQESITLIAQDADGMNEAVGSFYEAVAGMEPATRWSLPTAGPITPATRRDTPPALTHTMLVEMPDRIVGLKIAGGVVTAVSRDGAMIEGPLAGLAERGKRSVHERDLPDVIKSLATSIPQERLDAVQKSEPRFLPKLMVPLGERTAVAFWGGRLELRDASGKVVARSQMPQDVSAMSAEGQTLVIGLADGRILSVK